jgi:GNAT superfamily N-acetyltransferase
MRIDSPEAEEFAFIFDSWAKAFRMSDWAGVVRNCDWDVTSRAAMAELVDRPTARIEVMVVETEDGTRRIAGYSVSEPSRKILHWLYVKRDFRGMGIGRKLRRSLTSDQELSQWTYTYRTDASARFLRWCSQSMRHKPAAGRTIPKS